MIKINRNGNIYIYGVDLTLVNPTLMDIASCLAVRYDAGICKHRFERTGVLEIRQMRKDEITENPSINFMGSLYGNGSGYAGCVFGADGISPTLTTMQGGGRQPHVVEVEKVTDMGSNYATMKQDVKVRKFAVDIKKLANFLKTKKKEKGLSNEQIANQLDVPITMVEHWFRTDNYSAIPDADLWFDIKRILEIDTNEWDEQIITFEVREGVFEKSERVYFPDKVAPTMVGNCGEEKIVEVYPTTDDYEKVRIKQATKDGSIELPFGAIFDGAYVNSKTRRGRVQKDTNVAPTLTAEGTELYRLEICPCDKPGTVIVYLPASDTFYSCRVRKLMPIECFRLMGVHDDESEKMLAVNSNSQCFRQAGNSIVTDVLSAMYSQLGIEGIEKWNDRPLNFLER